MKKITAMLKPVWGALIILIIIGGSIFVLAFLVFAIRYAWNLGGSI